MGIEIAEDETDWLISYVNPLEKTNDLDMFLIGVMPSMC